MSDVAIRVDGLGKEYRIGGSQEKYRTLRDSLAGVLRRPSRKRAGDGADRFWALKDVGFEINRGEVVGVIGRNGAGKSTLLKVLSRITEPTTGYAEVHGRVGSLLEVGTGFHPELTGRENVYLNGAILGMRRAEIERQFDEIVAFAEVETFIDTPVKHYSSGMYLRLAFAVAAHLEPEILLVDEVLAVGDVQFQRKCLGKMSSVAAQGRTVLFVSHNLGAVKQLCSRGLLLERGNLASDGSAIQTLSRYVKQLDTDGPDAESGRSGWSAVHIAGAHADQGLSNGDPVSVSAALHADEPLRSVRLILVVEDADGEPILHNYRDVPSIDHGTTRVNLKIPPTWLMPDLYTLHLKLIATSESGKGIRWQSEHLPLNVVDHTGQSVGKVRAVLIPPVTWDLHAGQS